MPVQAWIGEHVCGQTQVISQPGGLAYKIQVNAESTFDPGCGSAGRRLTFLVNGQPMLLNLTVWDDSQAHFLTLGPPNNPLYLPIIQASVGK